MSMLGIVDWGIGGLDTFAKLRARGSTRPVMYWADSGSAPYGTLSATDLARRVQSVVGRLADAGCSQVVVACNAASSILDDPELHAAARARACEVIGVIRPTVEAIQRRGLDEVLVIGGRRTIESGAYAQPLQAGGCRVTSRVAQPLSALIERGLTEGPELEACLREILGPVHDTEHLVLACTHYCAAQPAIEALLPRLRTVIDPATETLDWMERHWAASPTPEGPATQRFVTTGDPAATRLAAHRAFGLQLPAFETLSLGPLELSQP
ncbi:MAG: aspartate/glutamate racemase family protein [Myxococcota bacterium]